MIGVGGGAGPEAGTGWAAVQARFGRVLVDRGGGRVHDARMEAEPRATHFKGWARPGPVAPGHAAGMGPGQGETLDALSGHFALFQLKDGHRFSTDDLLTAWYGSSWCPSARTALDLGSGLGTVGTICAWRLPGVRVVAVEAQSQSVALARRSAVFNGLHDRLDIREGDFRNSGVLGEGERFDLITGSPPYFPLGAGVEGDHPQKVACRFEVRGTVADYCWTASRHLAPGGLFACVFPTEAGSLARVEEGAAAAGLVVVRRRPVVFREGEAPLIALFGMMRADDLPEWFRGRTWVEPELVIRCRDGRVHAEYAAVKLSIGFPP